MKKKNLKGMPKRIVAFMLAVLMVLSLIPINDNRALAAEGEYTLTIKDTNENAIVNASVNVYEASTDEGTEKELVATGTSDENGNVTLVLETDKTIVANGTYTVECEGYEDYEITIAENQVYPIEVKLTSQELEEATTVTVSGKIILPDSETSYAGLTVELYKKGNDTENGADTSVGKAEIAEDGTYSFENVEIGSAYHILISEKNNTYKTIKKEVDLTTAPENNAVEVENTLEKNKVVSITFAETPYVVYVGGTTRTVSPVVKLEDTEITEGFTISYTSGNEQYVTIASDTNKIDAVVTPLQVTDEEIEMTAELTGADYITQSVKFKVQVKDKAESDKFNFLTEGISNEATYEVDFPTNENFSIDASAGIEGEETKDIEYRIEHLDTVEEGKEVAIIDEHGKITIKKVGTVTVFAKLLEVSNPNYEDTEISFTLVVNPIEQTNKPLFTKTWEAEYLFNDNNNEYDFSATTSETNATISSYVVKVVKDNGDGSVTKEENSNFAEIDGNGRLTVKKASTYEISAIATKENYEDEVISHTLTINPKLSFEKDEITVYNGEFFKEDYDFSKPKLNIEGISEEDIDYSVKYYNLDETEKIEELDIISVSEDGTVTFNEIKDVKKDDIIIKVTATYNTYSASYNIIVVDWKPSKEELNSYYTIDGKEYDETSWFSKNSITIQAKDGYKIFSSAPINKTELADEHASIEINNLVEGSNEIAFCVYNIEEGWISDWQTINVKIDTKEANVSITDENNNTFLEKLLYFFGGTKDFTIKVEEVFTEVDNGETIYIDNNSPIEIYTYKYKSENTVVEEDLEEVEDDKWIKAENVIVTENAENKETSATVTLSTNEATVIYVKVKDAAGNVSYANTNGLITDNIAPEITITSPETTTDEHGNGFDVLFDVNEADSFSGIKDVYYWTENENGQTYLIKDGVVSNTNNAIGDTDLIYTYVDGKITIKGEHYNTDGSLVVHIKAVDNSGNESEVMLHKPTIKVSFDKSSNPNIENCFSNDDSSDTLTATIGINSHSDVFNKEGVIITVNEGAESWTNEKLNLQWDDEKQEVKIAFPGSTDKYTLSIDYTDKEGNNTSCTKEFIFDTEVPKADIKIGETELQTTSTLPDELNYGVFKNTINGSVKVAVSAIDASDVDVYYYTYKGNENIGDVIKDEETLKNIAWNNYDENKGILLDLSEDKLAERYIVYFKLVDALGKTSYVSTNGFIIDNASGSISFSQNYEQKYYNTDVEISALVQENTGINSGIQKISYIVSTNGKTTQSGSWTETSNNNLEVNQAEAGKRVTFKVNAASNNSNNVKVTVTVLDKAGNEKSECVTLKIDSKEAKVTTSLDNQPNDAIYTKDVPVELTITDGDTSSGLSSIKYWLVSYGKQKSGEGEILDTASRKIIIDSNMYNGTYALYISVTDNAGNTTEKGPIKVDIDITAPKIELSYSDQDITPNVVGTKGYFDKGRTATITVTERTTHFDKDAFMKNIKITATDAKGKDVANAVPVVTFVKTTEGATENDAKHVFTIKYTADANYTFSASCTDKAGWTCADKSITSPTGTVTPKNFAIDTKAPTGTIKVADLGVWDKLLQTITFGLWSPSDVDIEMTADDVTSPIASIQYYKTSTFTALTKADLDTVTTWTDYSKFSVSKDDIFVIYGKITDNTGHVAYISSNGIVVDETKPVFETFSPEITLSLQQPVNGIYNDDVTVDVKVIDPKKGENNAYSGLKEIRYEVYNMGEKTQSGTLYKFNKEDPTQNQLKQSWDAKDIVVDAEKNNSNKVVVKVFATDNAGNNSNKSVSLKIDMTSPIIEVSYDNNEGDTTFEDNVYYNSKRVATIKVTERNFDASKVKVTITNSDGKVPKISEWTTKKGSGNGDNAVHTAKITYSADGDYTFKISMKDKAGNANKAVKYGDSQAPKAFTIDKTKPVISVSYDNNEAMSDNYYKADRTATITIQEHNFDDSRVEATITATDNGENVAVPSISRWSKSGDTYTATINYTDDAMYTFALAYTDMAGNEAEAIEEQSFYVDKTAPVMSIKGVVDETTNNEDTIGFVITATDTNFDIFTPVLTATVKTENGFSTKELDIAAISKTTNGREYKVSNIDADGIYRITCTLIDKAGNAYTDVTLYEKDGSAYVENRTAEDTLMSFSINRDGSVFEVDKTTSKVLDNYYVYDVKEDITIIEVNANTVSEQSITLNGETLKEGKDYEITTEGGNGNWMRYIYTIDKSLFAEEGEYTIVVSSVDEAENNAFSDVKDTKVSFVVDRTAPVVTISGMETEGRYQTDNQTVTLIPTDDGGAISSIVVYQVDKDGNIIGEPLMPELSGDALMEQMEANDGMIEFNLPSGNYDYIQVVCSDSCVNENGEPNIARILIEDVRISASAASLYMEDLVAPIAIGSVVVLAAIAGIVINKKKKSNKIK